MAVLTGRIATQPGMFGHMSEYTCQVEALRIHSFREVGLGASDVELGTEMVLGGTRD